MKPTTGRSRLSEEHHNVLFMVHDMGSHQPGWSHAPGGPLDILNQMSEQYSESFEGRDFGDLVECVEIGYSSVLDTSCRLWRRGRVPRCGDNGQSIKAEALARAVQFRLEKDSETEQRSPVTDVLLYHGFEDLRWQVRALVVEQLAAAITHHTAWAKAQGQRCRFTILAHGLGTVVAHDALHILSTQSQQEWRGIESTEGNEGWAWFSTPSFNFAGVFMLANLSDMLHTEFSPYRSVVRPGSSLRRHVNCNAYFNIRHELDPVAYPRAFDPVGWGSSYYPITLHHLRHADVHGVDHYLLHPRVHVPIFNLSAGCTVIPREKAIEASRPEAFPAHGGAVDRLQALGLAPRLQYLTARIGANPQIIEWAHVLDDYFELVEHWKRQAGFHENATSGHTGAWDRPARGV